MKPAGRFIGLAVIACAIGTSAARAEVLAEYVYDSGENFSPAIQGWTLGDETEEDVNFFNASGTSLLISEASQGPRALFTKTVPTSAFSNPWSITGNFRFAGNSQEEFGMFLFADDGTNLWHMSFYNHGNDDFDGIYMGGDPEGPVLSNTATKVFAEPVGAGPGGTPVNKPFDGFHDWALVDGDGAGADPPIVHFAGEALDPVITAVPAPSMFPAGTVGWGTLNPNEAGFFQTTRVAFESTVAEGTPGDFDDDGDIDGADFLLWQRNVGAADESSLNGNGDGAGGVDGGDLTLWKNNYGPGAAVAAGSPIPEPTSIIMLCGALATLHVGLMQRRVKR